MLRYRCDYRYCEDWRWVYGTTTDEQAARTEASTHRAAGKLVRLVSVEATVATPIERTIEDDTNPKPPY